MKKSPVCNAACLSFAPRRITAQIVASTLKTPNLENILALSLHLHATAICDKVSELQSATGAFQTQEPASTARGLQNFNLLFVAVAQGSGEPESATAQAMRADESAVWRVRNVRCIFALILILQISIRLLNQKKKKELCNIATIATMASLGHCNRRHHSCLWNTPENAIWCSTERLQLQVFVRWQPLRSLKWKC